MNAQDRSFPNIEELLNSCVIKKESKEAVTHTQYSQFRTRTFHIPTNLYGQFIQLYYNNIIKSKNTHNLIERQFIHKNGGPGPLLIDVDLQFNSEITERQYSDSHVEELIQWNLEELSNLFEMDEDNHFQIVVQEKPAPRVVTKPNGSSVTKDGIHIMFCVAIDPIYHTYLRKKY